MLHNLNYFARVAECSIGPHLPCENATSKCRLQSKMSFLFVGYRSSEFVPNGIKVVCSSRHTPRLQKLQKLSLYDNMLSSVKVRAQTPTLRRPAWCARNPSFT